MRCCDATLDLRDAATIANGVPMRKFLSLVLLVATQNGSDLVRLEAAPPGEMLDLQFPP